ncbi:hypothetical protein [Micromonospora globbae]|uniref:hypothetical protein n=1 Tax=Micromonospora globbae TaxID=1894969 RepID=UPI003866FDE9|nr:hypothetical protein OH732_01225 [Micromonospora globbae]
MDAYQGAGARLAFFESLPGRVEGMVPARVEGTLRIDLVGGGEAERWWVMMGSRGVRVGRRQRPAQAVLTLHPALFDRFVAGETPVVAALLRNEATFAGDVRLILTFQRFFPAPAGTGDPRVRAREDAQRTAA